MKTITIKEPINLRVIKFELDFSSLYQDQDKPRTQKALNKIKIPKQKVSNTKQTRNIPPPPQIKSAEQVFYYSIIFHLIHKKLYDIIFCIFK